MLVNEFIGKVADGTLMEKDIISFFSNDPKDIIESVAFDMWAYSVSLQEPSTPNNIRAIERIDEAVQLMEKHFGFSLFSKPQSEQAAPEPQQERPKQIDNGVLPEVLDIERVRQIFDGAIKKGWMHPNGQGGYKWVGFGKRGQGQQLVYMCGQIFGYVKGASGNDGANIPSKELEKLFGISGFYSKLIKCWEAKPQIWRKPIDEMIEQVTTSAPK